MTRHLSHCKVNFPPFIQYICAMLQAKYQKMKLFAWRCSRWLVILISVWLRYNLQSCDIQAVQKNMFININLEGVISPTQYVDFKSYNSQQCSCWLRMPPKLGKSSLDSSLSTFFFSVVSHFPPFFVDKGRILRN